MRILVANDGFSDAGGVQSYLDATIGCLVARGHMVAVAYCSDRGSPAINQTGHLFEQFQVTASRQPQAFDAIRRWQPDVCFSHNMRDHGVDAGLALVAPVVKFMHGYFGTCVGGLKMHAFPATIACDRKFGPSCAALYLTRRCGQLNPVTLVSEWQWAVAQRAMFDRYADIVVASEHMRREYTNNGVPAERVHANPLFATRPVVPARTPVPPVPRSVDRVGPVDPADRDLHVVFLGRMTKLKGGDLLVRAVADASSRLGRPVHLTMIGDGPQRADWEALARALGVQAHFTGWLTGESRWPMVERASLLAIPSVWPEPFGLVGLEAAALGVPAVATDTGGIRDWLQHDINGVLVPAPASPSTFGERLASLLSDPARLAALGAGALDRAREMSVDAHVSRLEPIFRGARRQRASA